MKLTERPKGLRVGTRVEIVASEILNTPWVGYEGKIERFTEPYDMALVRIDGGLERGEIFWVEELKALETEVSPA